MSLVMTVRFIFGDDWNDVPCKSLIDPWQWCNFSGIEALEFSCIYTRVYRATADVFQVVANTRTKSIQKQLKSINVDKVGSKQPWASKSCMLRVELIASSFLNLISKQARLSASAAVSAFLFAFWQELHKYCRH